MTISLPDKVRLLEAVGTGAAHSPLALKVLLHVIKCIDNNTGLSRISTARLAERAGTSKRNVLRVLDQLEHAGVLPVVQRGGATRDGVRMANVYRPNLNYRAQTGDTGVTGDRHGTGDMDDADRCHPCRGPVTPVSPLPSSSPEGFPEGEEEVSAVPAAASARAPAARGRRTVVATPAGEPEGFEEFWSACPKQEKKAEARAAYQRAIAEGRATAATLVTAMRQYATAKAGVADPRWLKLPHTWLEQGRWEDNPQPAKVKEPRPRPKAAETAKPAARTRAPAPPERGKAGVGGGQRPAAALRRGPAGSLAPPAPRAAPPPAAPPSATPQRPRGYAAGDRVVHVRSGLTGSVLSARDGIVSRGVV